MFDIIVTLALLTSPEVQFQYGMQFSKKGAYEESEMILKNVAKVSDRNLYHFFRLLNNFKMNNRIEAEKQQKALGDGFIDEMPYRYQMLSQIMTDDLKTWKKDDLGDIARDMSRIKDRLGAVKIGSDTQKLQKSVVDRLDKLIKEAEDQKAAAQQKAEQASQQREQGQGQDQKPMDDSRIGNDSGEGRVSTKRLQGIAENWGKLPEKEQARAMAELTRNMPPEYRDIIERYFKELARAK